MTVQITISDTVAESLRTVLFSMLKPPERQPDGRIVQAPMFADIDEWVKVVMQNNIAGLLQQKPTEEMLLVQAEIEAAQTKLRALASPDVLISGTSPVR